ncbi:MAG: hypothetical protein CXX72_04535 [Methanobacteriota archaeon]|nr:MAG: hypothetical protein CXX72_04535 [Euryarchaeota archaeon]
MDDEAVSAAIATVMLFAGTLAIISGMMVTITPMIDEMHGAIERQAMSSQMTDLAMETVRLSETGLPGDSATVPLRPHTGELGWDLKHGGTWYSASHVEGGTLRLDGVLDLDDQARFRYPTSEVSSICFDDLRGGPGALWQVRLPDIDGTWAATPVSTLELPLASTSLTIDDEGVETDVRLPYGVSLTGSVSAGGGDTWLQADGPLRVLVWRGDGGAALIAPDLAAPTEGTGRGWTLPVPGGTVIAHLVTIRPAIIEWTLGDQSGSGATSGSTAAWSGTWSAGSGDVLVLRSSAPGRLLLQWGSDAPESGSAGLLLQWGSDAPESGSAAGSTMWPDDTGSFVGRNFSLPAASGSLLLENSATQPVTASIHGLFHMVPAQGELRVDWTSGSGDISVSGPVQLHWLSDATGANAWRPGSLDLVRALDTGQASGQEHRIGVPHSNGDIDLLLQPAAPQTRVRLLTNLAPGEQSDVLLNHTGATHTARLASGASGLVRIEVNNSDASPDMPFRVYVASGSDGLTEVRSDGEGRCLYLGIRASGWVEVDLPWSDVSKLGDKGLRAAWADGTHLLGFALKLRGPLGDSPHSVLASAWGVHLPRLNYEFKSSVSGMEVGFRGGFVGTNHPEFHADVIVQPPSREGPGPRLAVTMQMTMPTADSALGNSKVDLDFTLVKRDQLTSTKAWEIRRGWDGPYGPAIAADASEDLAFSDDWLTFPGQLDLLDDHVGWVQLVPSSSESIYHAGGELILFNLQLAQLTSSMVVVV